MSRDVPRIRDMRTVPRDRNTSHNTKRPTIVPTKEDRIKVKFVGAIHVITAKKRRVTGAIYR
jgi:hypothetical protein